MLLKMRSARLQRYGVMAICSGFLLMLLVYSFVDNLYFLQLVAEAVTRIEVCDLFIIF